MEQTLFDKIITFSGTHFELFLYINGSLLALFLITYISIQMRFVSVRKLLYSSVRSVLYMTIILGQILAFAVLIRLYWINYKKPVPEIHISSNLNASTRWVREDMKVYYIDGNKLYSIKINGEDGEEVFSGSSAVQEYHFSPDGSHILVLTQNNLFLVDRYTSGQQKIDGLSLSEENSPAVQSKSIKGSVSNVRWAPDSRKFVYEIARWSKFGSQDNVYIYSLDDQKKRSIKSPTRRISSLYWNLQSDHLYYLRHEAQDTSVSATAFEVKVFRVPLITLVPEFVTQISYEKSSVPIENLNLRGIDLFLDGDQYSFGRSHQKEYKTSAGSLLGIDDEDYLYYVKYKWFRRRLFKIPRELSAAEMPRYQYKGGDLVIDHIRWLPEERYVIMEHKYWGVLILEPGTGKIGLLIQAQGHTFGWFEQNNT